MGSHTSMYADDIFAPDSQPEATSDAPLHAPLQRIGEETGEGKVESRTQLHVLGFPHVASENNPLNLPMHVRLYSALPESMTISKDGSTTEVPTGYVISDASKTFAHTEYRTTITGVDEIEVDENAPIEYFNLQGLRISNPESGSIVIRRQGAKAEKIRVP